MTKMLKYILDQGVWVEGPLFLGALSAAPKIDFTIIGNQN
jgi:hypothetical protein